MHRSSYILSLKLWFFCIFLSTALLSTVFVACSGDDGEVPTPDTSPTGDDDTVLGDDDTGTGDDDTLLGDDDTLLGDDDTVLGDDDTGAEATATPDAYPYPYERDIYLRGSFNSWTGDEEALASYRMVPMDEDTLYVEATLPFGTHTFKTADSAWSAGTNFGNPAGTNDVITLGVGKTLGDNGFDLYLSVETPGVYSFTLDVPTESPLTPTVTIEFLYEVEGTCAPNLNGASARWVNQDTIVWNSPEAAGYVLYHAEQGGLEYADGALTGGQAYPLTLRGTLDSTDPLYEDFPYLSGQELFSTSAFVGDIPALLTGQLLIASKDEAGMICDATGVQLAGVLDDLFSYQGGLGVDVDDAGVPSLRVWAPTARSVTLHLFDGPSDGAASQEVAMTAGAQGVWSVTGDASWIGKYYLYEVEVFVRTTGAVETNLVTDPYSIGLSMNSGRSLIVDLDDPATKPDGWEDLEKPGLEALEDIVLYELHMRDFSVGDATCPVEKQGRFAAFSERESDGMQHLSALAEAGLTHVHLLPAFDIATVNEDESVRTEPEIPTEEAPDSEAQQAAVRAVADLDAFNWGYDPYHYLVPEGSYASDPNGTARILEFRQMVQALNGAGLRVVMDQVYNHTNAAGQNEKSVLDKVVPGYYYRLDDDGNIQSSTCCPDTATEHKMMEKLMIDGVRHWATQYKVDGFRFDLMGHHTTENMRNLRSALDGMTLEADGVDGQKVYIYGEAWKFGSLDAILSSQAFHQANTYGLGIGSFNDRIRDSVRGGSPFAALYEQGFATGMWYDDNFLALDGGDETAYLEDQKVTLLNLADNIRLSMAGNLRDFVFTGADGAEVTGAEVVYRGSAGAGYTADPQENINYVSAHDNQTLWDNIQAKAPHLVAGRDPESADMEERIRMQNLSLAAVALGEGVPFFHAGSDLLRSKSGDKDSYNSGDWFNHLDWTYGANNWGVGLPVEDKNGNDWAFWGERLADVALTPAPEDIEAARQYFLELLALRKSSPLFRLQTAEEIMGRVRFLNAEAGAEQVPGFIAMLIRDDVAGLADLDGSYARVAVFLNATLEPVNFSHDLLEGLSLHPLQQGSTDAVTQTAVCDDGAGGAIIPAQTATVCVMVAG